jgi:hypothetical protein
VVIEITRFGFSLQKFSLLVSSERPGKCTFIKWPLLP